MIFLRQRVHLLTGKGGVGRTTLTAALGLAAQERRKRTLIAEVDDSDGSASALGYHFAQTQLSTTPTKISTYIDLCRLSAHTGHELFARSVIPVKAVVRAALRSKAIQGFLLATPAMHELGLFYHMLSLAEMRTEEGKPRYDIIIVDMPATGHALALTALPDIILGLMPKGPVADAMRRGQSIFNNPEITASWVVTLPERLPVTEALELLQGLQEAQVPVGGTILNRFRDDPFTVAEHEGLETMFATTQTIGESTYRRVALAQHALQRLRTSTSLPVIMLPDVSRIGQKFHTSGLYDTSQSPATLLIQALLASGGREADSPT